MFCQENRLSTAKHPADHTSPCPLELLFYLFPGSCGEKPLLCKVQPLRYIRAHTPSIWVPHTYPAMPIYLPIYPSIHFTLSRSSDLLPSHNQPALKGKAQSFISINHSPLHYQQNHLRTSCIKLDPLYFHPPPPLQPSADPRSDPSDRSHCRFQPQCFDEARYLCLKTTCNFLVSQGGRSFAATCWVSTCAFCLWAFTVITAWLDGPVQDTFQSERTRFMWKISACLVFLPHLTCWDVRFSGLKVSPPNVFSGCLYLSVHECFHLLLSLWEQVCLRPSEFRRGFAERVDISGNDIFGWWWGFGFS